MAFLSNDDKNKLSHQEANSQWFNLLSGGEKIMMFIVGLLVYMYLIFWVWSINFSDLFLLQMLIRFGAVVLGAGLITFLLQLEKIAMIEFIESFGTAGIKDDIWKGAISVLLVIGFYFAECEGSARFLNTVNGYTANIVKDHNEDKRVSENKGSRASLEKEKDLKIKTVSCVECKAIEANYNILISNERRNKKAYKSTHTDSDKRYISSQNDKISKRISILEDEKANKIDLANARFETKKDSISMSYENRINRIDTMVLSLKSNIDSSNASEIKKEEDITRSNNRNGGYLSAICMFFLCFNRWMLVKYYRQAGMSWASIGEFMRGADFLIKIFTPINIKFIEFGEKLSISNSIRYSKMYDNLESHKIEKTKGDKNALEFVDKKISNRVNADLLHVKQKSQKEQNEDDKNKVILELQQEENILKKVVENVENMSEKDIILGIIKAFEIAKDYEPTEQGIKEIDGIISAFRIALDYV